MPETYRRTILVASLGVWIIALAAGAAVLLQYAGTPGLPAAPPADLPVNALLKAAQGKSALLLFVHPQCPCSRATLEELARIVACCKDRVESTIFFYSPPGFAHNWVETDLWDTATAIPGVRVVADLDAAAARQFRARTSGQVLLYGPNRRLAFEGGITAVRGHAGDNDGRDAIVSLLLTNDAHRRKTPVFGCALYGER